MALDLKQMERDILETVRARGEISGYYCSISPTSQFLLDKYPPGEGENERLVLIDYLVEERFLFPIVDPSSHEAISGFTRGITPKGLTRLRELQAPRWHWFKGNWFPVIVAAITAGIGVGSIIVDVTCNRG